MQKSHEDEDASNVNDTCLQTAEARQTSWTLSSYSNRVSLVILIQLDLRATERFSQRQFDSKRDVFLQSERNIC